MNNPWPCARTSRRLVSTWMLTSALSLASGCPNQELAPLSPCTASGVSIAAAGDAVDKVDLLFVVDNSGSMAEEQDKLLRELPRLVQVLTSGDLDGVPNANGKPDFPPVASLHLGVVSTDLGLNGEMIAGSCGKAFGDEGRLLSSTDVAVQGVRTAGTMERPSEQKIAPRPECALVNVPRFIDFTAGQSSAMVTAQQFSCVAELGIQGCGIEQQLESMWRALAPSTNGDFSRRSTGQGAPMGYNAGFLRDEAVLAVILVSDEEDCSAPDASAKLVYDGRDIKTVNVLCARNPDKLHNVARYIDGLKSLKPKAYEDRIIFAGIVGVPKSERTRDLTLEQVLALPEMRVEEVADTRGSLTVRPACVASNNQGEAAPAQRIVRVAQGFGKNGVITSICEDDYKPALNVVLNKIASQLTGQCLPRVFQRNTQSQLIDCSVVELKAPNDAKSCAETPGRTRELEPRTINGVQRRVCEVAQLAVANRTLPNGAGWYYDDFSDEAKKCAGFASRVEFTKSAPLSPGAIARIECYRTVPQIESNAKGAAAVNTPCVNDGGDGPQGEAKCSALSLPGEALICITGACQLACENDSVCPPGQVCARDATNRGYCENPTCPASEQN